MADKKQEVLLEVKTLRNTLQLTQVCSVVIKNTLKQ